MKRGFFLSAIFTLVACIPANIAQATDTTTYTYDALGRLVTATHSGSVVKSVSVSHDPADNRTNYYVGDAAPAYLSIGNTSATEGGNLVFTVTRSGNTASAVTVNFATASGTATSGSDFTANSGTLSFAASQTSKTITVATIDDTVVEPSETMTVNLSGASSGAVITAAVGTGTIIDNDGWTASLTAGTYCLNIFGSCLTETGYNSGLMGSMSNTAYGSYTVTGLYSMNGGSIIFTLNNPSGTAPPNSGWTSIAVPGVGTLTRATGSYSSSGSQATWSWTNSSVVTSGTVLIQ